MGKRLLVFCLVLLCAGPALAAKPIGKVKLLKGDLWIIRGEKKLKGEKGSPLHTGDLVRTGKKSKAQLMMQNKKVLFLAASSEIKLKIQKVKKKDTLDVDMVYGKIRAIVGGARTKHPKVKIKTGTTVAGVRGTKFEVIKPKGGKAASFINLDSGRNSMEVREVGKKKSYNLPAGAYSTLATGSPMLPPTAIPAHQVNYFLQTGVDGKLAGSVFDENGREVETRTQYPPGTEDLKAPVEPLFLTRGRIPPPAGYRISRSKNGFTYRPYRRETVAVNPDDGGFLPVVGVGASYSEGEVLSRLLNSKRYRQKLALSIKAKKQIAVMKIAVVLADKKGDKKSLLKLSPKLRTLEIADLENKKAMEGMRLRERRKFYKDGFNHLINFYEKSNDRQKLDQLKQEREVLKKQIALSKSEIKLLETQKQLKVHYSQSTAKKYGQLGLLAYGSGKWLGDRWQIAQANPNEGPAALAAATQEIKASYIEQANAFAKARSGLQRIKSQMVRREISRTTAKYSGYFHKSQKNTKVIVKNTNGASMVIDRDLDKERSRQRDSASTQGEQKEGKKETQSTEQKTTTGDTAQAEAESTETTESIAQVDAPPVDDEPLPNLDAITQETDVGEMMAEIVKTERFDEAPRGPSGRGPSPTKIAPTLNQDVRAAVRDETVAAVIGDTEIDMEKPEETLTKLCDSGCAILSDPEVPESPIDPDPVMPPPPPPEECPPSVCQAEGPPEVEPGACEDADACSGPVDPEGPIAGDPCVLDPGNPACQGPGANDPCTIDPGSCAGGGDTTNTVQTITVRVTAQ